MFNKAIYALSITMSITFSLVSSSIYSQGYVVSSSSYSQIIESNPGVIVARNWVRIHTKTGNSQGAGTAVGAISGGLIGSNVGKGSGHVAGAIGGAILGGLIGNSVGKNIEHGYDDYRFEYTIRLYNGQLLTVWESPDVNLAVGQNVVFERSNDGRTFLIPQY